VKRLINADEPLFSNEVYLTYDSQVG